MFNNIKGAIFDLDGTLVDSMYVWRKIDIEYLERKGHSIPENLGDNISHMSFAQVAAYFKNRFNIQDSIEEILEDWHNSAFEEYSKHVKLKPGVKEFLLKLKNNNIKIGLATSNSVPLLEACLKNNEIYDYFDCITLTDEVAHAKDHPDVYLLAAKRLNLNPENCIVFEDILAAVKGAKSAKMKVAAVYDKESSTSKEEFLKYADLYIDSYLDLV